MNAERGERQAEAAKLRFATDEIGREYILYREGLAQPGRFMKRRQRARSGARLLHCTTGVAPLEAPPSAS